MVYDVQSSEFKTHTTAATPTPPLPPPLHVHKL